MKVYYVGGGYDGCYLVRCLLPLVANGWDGERTSLYGNRATSEQMMRGAMDADVVVFQRPLLKDRLQVAKLLKLAGKKIVMDNDDTYTKESGIPDQFIGEDSEKVNRRLSLIDKNLTDFARFSDLVTVTTEFLKKEYSSHTDKVTVLPNCIDPDYFDEPLRNESKKVRIGLIGSVATNKDYEMIIPLLKELSRRKDVQLVVFSLPPDMQGYEDQRRVYKPEIEFWNSLNIEWHPRVGISEYYDKLNELRLDIGLIPRQENYFNKCKSNIKYLELSMFEIPTIVQNFKGSPYENDLAYQARNLDEWYSAVEEMIGDKKLRKKLGKESKDYVLKNFNINDHAHRWEKAYENI